MPKKKKKVKGIKALNDEQKTILENAWYQYDEDGSESLDFWEVFSIMTTMLDTELPEEDVKELYETMDDDGDKQVSFTEYMTHMEKYLKKHPLAQVNEFLGKLARGPQGSQEWIRRDAVSEEEEKALKGLQGVKYLLKPEMLEALRRLRSPPKHVDTVCCAAKLLLEGGQPEMDWSTLQHWLRGGEDLIFKLAGFHKRIDVGQVQQKRLGVVRQLIVDIPEAFRSDLLQAAAEGPAGMCAAQLANWVLICIRYFDAVVANMQIVVQNQGVGGIDGAAYAAASLNVRSAIPKALESFHVQKLPILFDPKGLALQFLKYKKARTLNLVDPRHLFKEALQREVLHCIEEGVPLVMRWAEEMSLDDANICAAFEEVQPNLYADLLAGKSADPEFVQQLKGDATASSKSPGTFAIYLLTKVEVLPTWLPYDGYVVIQVE